MPPTRPPTPPTTLTLRRRFRDRSVCSRTRSVAIGIVIADRGGVGDRGIDPIRWHDDSPINLKVFGAIPGALKFAFCIGHPDHVHLIGSVMFANRVRNWEMAAGPDRRTITPKERQKRMEKLRRAVRNTDPAATRRRDHALDDLLRHPGAVGGHLDPGDQPPAAEGIGSSTAASTNVLVHRRPGGGVVFPPDVTWAIIAPLHPAAVPHPHQDQAAARGHPRRAVRYRRRGFLAEGLASPTGMPSFEKWSFIGYPWRPTCREPQDTWHQVMWVAPSLPSSPSW